MINYNNILVCTRCRHAWKKRGGNDPKFCPKCKTPYWNKERRRIPRPLVEDYEKSIISLHNGVINISGGEHGIRDNGGVYYSTYHLLQYIDKNPGNPIGMGTLIFNEFARKHHFVDGNKRTAFVVAKTFMLVNRCHLKVEYKEALEFILKIAEYNSKVTSEEISDWLKCNCEIIEDKEVETYINKIFVSLHRGAKHGN
jgi:death-on-curing protein